MIGSLCLLGSALASEAPTPETPPSAPMAYAEPAPWPPESNMAPNHLTELLTPKQMRRRHLGLAASAASFALLGGLGLMAPIALNDPSDTGAMISMASLATVGLLVPVVWTSHSASWTTQSAALAEGVDLESTWLLASALALAGGTALSVIGLSTFSLPVLEAGLALSATAPVLLFCAHHHMRVRAKQLVLAPIPQGAAAGLTLRF